MGWREATAFVTARPKTFRVRFSYFSLGLEALGLGKWGLKNVKGFRKGIRAEGGGDNTDHTRRVLKHLVYEKPRFSRFEIGTVSKIPIIKADKDKWLFQLAVKNILTTG